MKYRFSLIMEAEDETKVKEVATKLQSTLEICDADDIVKLLSKVIKKPSLIKTALKFI